MASDATGGRSATGACGKCAACGTHGRIIRAVLRQQTTGEEDLVTRTFSGGTCRRPQAASSSPSHLVSKIARTTAAGPTLPGSLNGNRMLDAAHGIRIAADGRATVCTGKVSSARHRSLRWRNRRRRNSIRRWGRT